MQKSEAVYVSHGNVNTFRLRRNGQHFTDDIFKRIFFSENVWISIKISLKIVPTGPITNFLALVQIMAWRRPGDKPSSMNQWWLVYRRIYESLGFNELTLLPCESWWHICTFGSGIGLAPATRRLSHSCWYIYQMLLILVISHYLWSWPMLWFIYTAVLGPKYHECHRTAMLWNVSVRWLL